MDRVRKYLYELARLNEKSVKPSKDRMLELKEKHDNLVKHYNDRVDYHNTLVQALYDKQHAENEEFIKDVKRQIQEIIAEWTSD